MATIQKINILALVSFSLLQTVLVRTYRFATIQSVTDDSQTDDRRHTVPKARPIVPSAKQEGKTNLDLLEQEIASGSGIS